MEDEILSRALSVRDRQRATALSNPLRRRVILSLVSEGRSVSELAPALGVELKRLHYHVCALVKLGLLTVQDVVPRGGRPIKQYVAVAQAFYVPGDVPVPAAGEAMSSELGRSLAERRRVAGLGTVYYVDAEGNHRIRLVRKTRSNEHAWMERWQLLKLSPARARRLTDELSACIARALTDRDDGQVRGYLLHLALAPRLRRPDAKG